MLLQETFFISFYFSFYCLRSHHYSSQFLLYILCSFCVPHKVTYVTGQNISIFLLSNICSSHTSKDYNTLYFFLFSFSSQSHLTILSFLSKPLDHFIYHLFDILYFSSSYTSVKIIVGFCCCFVSQGRVLDLFLFYLVLFGLTHDISLSNFLGMQFHHLLHLLFLLPTCHIQI